MTKHWKKIIVGLSLPATLGAGVLGSVPPDNTARREEWNESWTQSQCFPIKDFSLRADCNELAYLKNRVDFADKHFDFQGTKNLETGSYDVFGWRNRQKESSADFENWKKSNPMVNDNVAVVKAQTLLGNYVEVYEGGEFFEQRYKGIAPTISNPVTRLGGKALALVVNTAYAAFASDDFESYSAPGALGNGGSGWGGGWASCTTEEAAVKQSFGSGAVIMAGWDATGLCNRTMSAANTTADAEYQFKTENRETTDGAYHFWNNPSDQIQIFYGLFGNGQHAITNNTTNTNLGAYVASTSYTVTIKPTVYTNGCDATHETFQIKIDGYDLGNGTGAYSNNYNMHTCASRDHSTGSKILHSYSSGEGGAAGSSASWDDLGPPAAAATGVVVPLMDDGTWFNLL